MPASARSLAHAVHVVCCVSRSAIFTRIATELAALELRLIKWIVGTGIAVAARWRRGRRGSVGAVERTASRRRPGAIFGGPQCSEWVRWRFAPSEREVVLRERP